MNRLHLIKVVSFVLLFFISFAAEAGIREVGFLKAMKTKQVDLLRLVSNGGYMGKCLSISLKNNTRSPLTVKMDPALIFVPPDDKYQNLVAVGEESITIQPGETKTESLQTFCGKAPAMGPIKELNYKFWKQGDPEFIKASVYIREHNLYNYVGQHAVWMFTNNHKLNNVYASDHYEEAAKKFVAYLANITHQKIPEYYNYHKINAGNGRYAVYEKTISKVFVRLEWSGEFRRNVHIQILDENRKLYKTIHDGEIINSKGQHKIVVTLDPKDMKAGVYYVQLKDDDNRIWIEKRAMLEAS